LRYHIRKPHLVVAGVEGNACAMRGPSLDLEEHRRLRLPPPDLACSCEVDQRCTYCLDMDFNPSRTIAFAMPGDVPWKRIAGGIADSRCSMGGHIGT
jgi:hypothetical protein